MSTKAKGGALEDVVALLHKMSTASVETRAKLPVLGSSRPREIDVLISQDVAGYPVKIVIECKNYGKAIGKGLIDEFLGKLHDVGIPTSQGIYVSPFEYTKGAKERARRAGIRLLRLDGLNEERMAAALNDALLSVVHYVLFVETISMFPYMPFGGGIEPVRVPPGIRLSEPLVYEVLWRRWVTGKLPGKAGESMVPIVTNSSEGAMVQCRVIAYAGAIPGTLSQLSLINVETAKTERTRLEANFKMPNTVDLVPLRSEADVDALGTELVGKTRVVVNRVRVPRIVAGPVFWPPSTEAIAKISELRNGGEPITFANVEGRDLSRAWEYFEARRATTAR